MFRRAKAAAAESGQSLKDYFTEVLADHLRRGGLGTGAKPWETAFGALRDLHRENRRIDRLIAAEFGTIDEEQWR
jgi:hypothetical protein